MIISAICTCIASGSYMSVFHGMCLPYSWEQLQFHQMYLSYLLISSRIRSWMFLISSGTASNNCPNFFIICCFLKESSDVIVSLHSYSLGSVMCLGVTAGAYVLTLFAVSVCMIRSSKHVLQFLLTVLFYIILDKVPGKGSWPYVGFTSMQSTILE